ncbi:MAG: hypothetical protein E6Q97_02800 [Desulfurellales bacterium]|nr:MAG: hypothetical protein E6Q97_02800 [Desulfurellales bacterium]
MSSPVAELYVKLGLNVDKGGFTSGTAAIENLAFKIKSLQEGLDLQRLMDRAGLGQRMDPDKALALIGLPGPEALKRPGVLTRLREGAGQFVSKYGLALGAAGLATKLSTDFVGGMLANATNRAGDLADTAQRFGVGVEALQELEYAAKMAGGNLQDLQAGFRGLALNLDDVGKADSPIRQVMKDLGISAKDPALATLDGAFERFAGSLSQLPDGAAKTAAAMKVFGKGGLALIPLLNEGPKGIAKLRQEARDLGLVVSAKANTATDALGDNIDKLKLSVGALKNQAIAALVPALRETVDKAVEWVKANKELVTNSLQRFIRGTAFVVDMLGKAFTTIIEIGGWVADNFDGIAVAIGAMTAATLIYQGVAIPAALKSAAAWFAAAAPFLLVAAKIALIGLAVEDLYQWITGGESVFKDMYWAARHWIADKIGEVVDGVKRTFQQLWQDVKAIFDKIIAAKDKVVGFVGDVWDSAVDFGKNALSEVGIGGISFNPNVGDTVARAAQAQNKTLAPVFNISGAQDPKAVAAAVDQAIKDSWLYNLASTGMAR